MGLVGVLESFRNEARPIGVFSGGFYTEPSDAAGVRCLSPKSFKPLRSHPWPERSILRGDLATHPQGELTRRAGASTTVSLLL